MAGFADSRYRPFRHRYLSTSPISFRWVYTAGCDLSTSLVVSSAQTMRAILLASATTATRYGFRASSDVAHFVVAGLPLRAYRSTACAPRTRSFEGRDRPSY